jgi:hypothetical protein
MGFTILARKQDNNPANMKFKFLFPIFIVVGFVVTAVVLYFAFKTATSDFVETTYEDAYEGRVESCTDYKGYGYVILANKKKYWFPNSRNYNYTPFTLSEFLQVGDVITKNKNSQDLIIDREGRQYIFIIGKDIKKE